MELIIDGLHKLQSLSFSERKIERIHIDTRARYSNATSYVFTFPPIGNGLEGWDKEFEVYLCKYPTPDEKYELFVMGLHGVTCYDCSLREIKNFEKFTNLMDTVVMGSKVFWESNQSIYNV
jgi:hypothetical protein